jgi:ATP-dependent Lon protease
MAKAKSKKQRANNAESESTLGEQPVDIFDSSFPKVLPVLPSKDLVAFPSVMMSLYVGRAPSIEAVEQAIASEKLIFIVAQSNLEVEDPQGKDLYQLGVIAHLIRCIRLPDGRQKVLIQGLGRGRALRYKSNEGHIEVRVDPIRTDNNPEITAELEGILNRISENLQVLVEYEHLPEEMLLVSEEASDPGALADIVLAHYKLPPNVAQKALEELSAIERIRLTDAIITDDLNQFLLSEKIKDRTRDELSKGQKEYFLREQMRQIQRELGENEGESDDLQTLKKALVKAQLPKEANDEAQKQLRRLERMHVESSEYALLRTYLEWISDLPWSKTTRDRLQLNLAQKIFEEDHYGLQKAKERIIEFLSVRKLNPDSKGPILCLVGPPGVGKTSLGRSVARALNRRFVRIALGGVRDEAEIRGHRRTYVGALPGRVIQGLKQAGTRNPVILLDELDKVGNDFRGDPASALLEVLDPAQNKTFHDHYLNLSFDLSSAIFIATANTLDTVPPALLDRLEVISIAGYTSQEKFHIARRFLIPRQSEENGVKQLGIQVTDEAIRFLIERYTEEAGVRSLEREVGTLFRKIARTFAETKKSPRSVTQETVRELLGATKYDPESEDGEARIGFVRGLAWTVHGGEVMPIEVSVAPGSGKLTLTGQLGSVMQESAQAAVFYARANAKNLGLPLDFHQTKDIHVHVPNGATPKDGPSAGITIATAIVSALSERPVVSTIAMTGEITLRGAVMPIGGLKEKSLAALRLGLKKVIIPFANLKDVDEVPAEERKKIKFIPVKHIGEVLEIALESGVTQKNSKRGKRRGKSTLRANV